MTRLTVKEILIAAAKRIENCSSNFCCMAIKAAAGMYGDEVTEHNTTAYVHAHTLFEATQKPASVTDADGPWWPHPLLQPKYRQERADALRRAAALATNFN